MMRYLRIIFFIACFSILAASVFVVAAPKCSDTGGYLIIADTDELEEHLNGFESKNERVLLDLRDDEDFKKVHIGEAINIDGGSEDSLVEMLNKMEDNGRYVRNETEIILMCYSGKRAADAFNFLVKEGYLKVTYVTFGFEEYMEGYSGGISLESGECKCKEY
ncbi:Rhodanese-related sulfurtransferase [Dethiosulfatibacter aminovorans DSM 17477]|uniref:Rhodanese-related sulfurtransferase n=1 Tax=Dethiosulfatibacter aminovorans DSM 17477 TaxID=1121476 RepID=A0A1M6AZI1_9FIRM|nr:rhodanese-like domain-containing protein [Dethiosulfatibacter aminovorans]SHI41909.1 Rhodanese-related sulfurtransferase [Dethiosulfatibacter aminovorans DSM 17477]